MNVLFLYTGGTIGMVGTPRGLEPGGDVEAEIASLLRDRPDLTTGFARFEHLIDSSDATPEDWQRIVDRLRAHRDEHDAFVVLHGTDTLAHSAAAASYALAGFGKPVVFTGAQVPFGMPGSDAPDNVRGAVEAVADAAIGRAVFFDGELIAGTRATKSSALDRHGFTSPHPAPAAERPAPDLGVPLAPYRRHDIAVVTAVPGMTAERFRHLTSPAPDAVLLRGYGLGVGPSGEPGFTRVIEDLNSGGTPVVVLSQSQRSRIDLERYAAGRALLDAGAIGAADMTFEAAYTKLCFLLSQDLPAADLPTWLHTDLAGELTLRAEPVATALG
ncbi:asparaginase [Saccharopolyspora gregorii]|uniref:asparaginase n=1 Tax=Saccharopolyspora gregorii TaxID=33914 RepID=UPI0021AC181C|nr:asparaginase [Saccharopolyspora gregorii]